MSRYWYAGEPGRTFLVDACAHGVWLDSGELQKAAELLRGFDQTRNELQKTGKIDAALARAAGTDEGPYSILQDKMWAVISSFLGAKVGR